MQRFFIPNKDINKGLVLIKGGHRNHIKNVLRKRNEDYIQIFDETGNAYLVQITDLRKQRIEGKVIREIKKSNEPPIKIHLYQAIPKSTKIEFIIQKCVEIGIYSIYPILSERTVVKLNTSSFERKLKRWQKIAQSACEQSGRAIIPQIFQPESFSQAISALTLANRRIGLILWEEESEERLKSFLKKNPVLKQNNSHINLFIGPEGGFTPKEIEMARKKGVIPVSLGRRILRTETAGIVAISLILYECGDLG